MTVADLIFADSSHTYMLDGYVIPSVSELCDPMHKEAYKDAPKWQLEVAAERGTAVHEATQQFDRTGSADVAEEHLPYLLAYRDFVVEHKPAWELTEQPMYHEEHMYAGTPDRYGMIAGKKTLVDIKTTYTVIKPSCTAQLNLYRLMLIAKGYEVEQMAILHLKRDGTYKLIAIQEDEPLALALIKIHKCLHPRRKKGTKYV